MINSFPCILFDLFSHELVKLMIRSENCKTSLISCVIVYFVSSSDNEEDMAPVYSTHSSTHQDSGQVTQERGESDNNDDSSFYF